MSKKSTPIEKRFWSKVNKKEPDDCWEWISYKFSNGYGAIKVDGQNVGAHRISYKLNVGDPKDLHVCHKCDNPSCVNPKHLFLGTNLENTQDRNRKNRQAKPMGILHPNVKLSEQDIIDIREKINQGRTQRSIAKDYGISQQQVCAINTKKAWKHL
jgi:HNH endonuclease